MAGSCILEQSRYTIAVGGDCTLPVVLDHAGVPRGSRPLQPRREANADAIHQCKERERLMAELQAAINDAIRTQDEPEADVGVKKWRAARAAFMRYLQGHGC